MTPLLIAFDSNGLERVDFYRVREQLLRDNTQFDAAILRVIPYSQLSLCSIGNAGAARCSLDLVREEKQARRRRFEEMSPDRLHQVKRYIQSEGMFTDIHRTTTLRSCPTWDDLTLMQKLWHTLTCIHHHSDNPRERLLRAERLFFRAGNEDRLPLTAAHQFVDRMGQLLNQPPAPGRGKNFSFIVAGYAEEIMQRMPTAERTICARELVRDYRCTSDCFQPAGNQDF